MLLTGLLFVGVTVIVRYLGTDMNPIQSAFIRYAFGTALIAHAFFLFVRGLVLEHRITSYNVCYTKLLRFLDTEGMLALDFQRGVRLRSRFENRSTP